MPSILELKMVKLHLLLHIKGSKQITFAIIATTLILVAVFLPLIFIKGISGTLFKETAIALSFSIVVSSFVALTLSPMLGSKFLNKKEKINFFVKNLIMDLNLLLAFILIL
jgi:HAE1 family hydrophobic/amphiphilic exporter-1/multidrug efflux pump